MNFAEFRAARLDNLIKSGVSCFSAKNIVTSAEFRAEYERKEAAERAAKEERERAAKEERERLLKEVAESAAKEAAALDELERVKK